MKRAFLFLAMTAGLLTSATGADECFDDTGWQQGPSDAWFVNWDKAVAESKKSGKPIFVLSTGSDWCGWCKKLKKDVLMTESFNDFAKKNLVLLYLDSPRKPLSEAQTLHNRTICRELRLSGGVPSAAVFAADARRLGVLSGGGYTASNYVERLEKILAEKGELPKSGQPSKIFTEGYVEPPKKAVTWKYEIVGDGVVLGRSGKGFGPAVEGDAFGALVIPEKIEGKPVRGIGNGAFSGRSGLTSVTIPESVTNIGLSAFFGCGGLKSITLPKRMTRIGEFAFRSCSGLSSMTIPDGVTHIESATFLFCTGLKSVTIPASVESIRPGAFAHCDSLSAFTVDGANPAFCSKNGMICSKDGRKLVVGVNGDVEIPDGVALVKCCAFDDLAGLKSVKMPSSVENVEEDAFMGCSGLVSFSIDSSNASFSTRNGLLCSKDGKTVVIGVNGEVKIPNGVTTIKDRAFHDFAGVKSIEIPESVTRVGRYAFDGCEALADADGFVIVKGILFGYFGKASSVEIPENVRIIGSGAFTWRCGFKSVTIPPSVTNIEGSAFYCSKGLESLAIPSSMTQIEHGAFDHCTGLKTVILPSSVTSIRGYAFGGCTSLVDVDIQGSGVKVEARAFPEQIRSKLPDLSNPIGPIHVVVGKDEGKTGNKGSVASQETRNAPVSESWQRGPSDTWFVKWDDAVAEAKKTKKPIFVLSTGSDWCGWCIRLRKNVLSKPEFEAFAKKNLVLLYLDSPSKAPLCAEQKKHNQEVSRKLSLGGGVPNASVVTAGGKKLGSISGGGLELEDYLGKLEEIIGKNSEKSVVDAISDLVLSTNDLVRCDAKRFVTVAVPVDNVRAEEVTNVVALLIGTNGFVRVLKDINALLLTGEAKNVRSACEAVRVNDNSANKFVERSWCLKHAKAEDAKRILDRFAAGFKPATFRQVPPCKDIPIKCLCIARTEQVARGILSVNAEGKKNWLTVRMVGSASAAQWDLIDDLVKAIDFPSQDEELAEQKYVLRHRDPDCVASAMNALLGAGVAVVAAGETNAVVAHVRRDLQELLEDIAVHADLCIADWNVALDVRRVPGVKTIREARQRAGEKDAGVDEVCRVTLRVMDGRTGVLTGRLDKDDPETAFRLTVEPRWAGNKELMLKWEVHGCEQTENPFHMSGATVMCQDQGKVIGGMMRAESRGFLGLGASDDLDTAYLLRATVSEKSRAY